MSDYPDILVMNAFQKVKAAMSEKADYAEARAVYDKAWRAYVAAPGDREQARAALGEARDAMDKAWFTCNRTEGT